MPEKQKQVEREDVVELETQVILRMPKEPAQALRETLREGGPNLEKRLAVKLENDLRYGEVRFDHWLMYTKLVDLPTVTESLKTIDLKSFYKTADVCQMLMCKFEPDVPTTDDESPTKNKKKDPHKVDKKFLWPHGITPPCKNVRKRRFRKTLKKKYVEAPEIEKEVKRLLRADNEAVNVKWDIVTEEEDPNKAGTMLGNDESTSQSAAAIDMAGTSEQDGKPCKSNTDKLLNDDGSDAIPRDIDIFGEDLSSSDEEENNINVDVDETSRLSADDSRSMLSSSMANTSMATEFNKQMFNCSPSRSRQISDSMDRSTPPASSSRGFFDSERMGDTDDNDYSMPNLSQEELNTKISDLRRQLNDLRDQRIQKETEISSIENQTLRQRMQDALDNILSQISDKKKEMQDYQSMLG